MVGQKATLPHKYTNTYIIYRRDTIQRLTSDSYMYEQDKQITSPR